MQEIYLSDHPSMIRGGTKGIQRLDNFKESFDFELYYYNLFIFFI